MESKWWYLICAVVCLIVLSQVLIFGVAREHWFDTSFSLEIAHLLRENGPGSITWQEMDVHPPTYYYTLYAWSFLNPGLSEYKWGMELSVLFGCVFLLFVFIGLWKLFGVTGGLATIFLSLCTTYLHYATEVRAYMLIMMLSAIIFAAIIQGLEKWKWRWAAYISLFLLPMVHYLALMAAPFFVVLYYVVEKKRGNKPNIHTLLRLILASALGTMITLSWAIPQRMRTIGTWFPNSGFSDFPSALLYAFFIVPEHGDYSSIGIQVYSVIYILFEVAVVIAAIAAVKSMWKKMDEKRAVLVLMGLTALYPFAYLTVLVVSRLFLGTGGFLSLYHHRFFLVVLWMFAVAMFIVFVEWLKTVRKSIAVIAVIVLMSCMAILSVLYMTAAHHELENMMKATPCTDELLMIGHESPFSSLPYEVYGREHGCHWKNFISTEVDKGMANGGGFDAIWDTQEVYWNLTLPDYGFYYVQSVAKEFPLDKENRTYKVVAQDEGISLLVVAPVDKGVNVNVEFR